MCWLVEESKVIYCSGLDWNYFILVCYCIKASCADTVKQRGWSYSSCRGRGEHWVCSLIAAEVIPILPTFAFRK